MLNQPQSYPNKGVPDGVSTFVIRPITSNDIDAFQRFAVVSTSGMFNLPKDRSLIEDKIKRSIEAFAKQSSEIGFDQYIFVLEDPKSGELGGTCAVKAKTGRKGPLFFYKIETDITKDVEIRYLRPIKYESSTTEICGLFILPEYRHSGLGRLLSLSRFLFIANFPERFDDTVFAEMRGVIDKNHNSPFWNGVGRHFYNVEFDKIMEMQQQGRNFIADVIPRYPIYISFLPKEAQEVIGITHPDTKPALIMLEMEGFKPTHEIDMFDAGPRIAAQKNHIRTIKKSIVAEVEGIDILYQESEPMIISNTSINFRCCLGKIEIVKPNCITLSPEVASALNVKVGDKVRYVTAH
jgi:arginine N-succinyltransferase